MAKNNNTKNAILSKGLEITSRLSLEAISIGELAKEMNMSKSGVFAHFKSKENLQLEILEYAASRFAKEVILESLKVEKGIPRIKSVINLWKQWGELFEGGCIFVTAATEFNVRPGIIQQKLLNQEKEFITVLTKITKSAVKVGDLNKKIDCEQFAYEIYTLVYGHYFYRQSIDDPKVDERINKAVERLIKNYS